MDDVPGSLNRQVCRSSASIQYGVHAHSSILPSSMLLRFALVLTCCTSPVLYAGATAQAQTSDTLPSGRAGDAVRAYLAAIKTADSVAIRGWLVRYDPEGDMTVRTGRQLALARRTGGFTVEHVVRGTPDVVEAIVREQRSGDRIRFLLVLGANGVAEGFGLEAVTGDGPAPQSAPRPEPATAATPSPAPGPSAGGQRALIGTPELVKRLRAFADSLAHIDQFSGVISVSQNGAPVFEKAYGEANRETHTPNTLESAFNLGSINKLFTATAVRQLALAGKLQLDSSLASAWPDYPNQEVARRVTVRQILQHRSGIMGDIFHVPGVSAPGEITHNRQFLAGFVRDSLQFAPGSREQYSNAGYVVLGALIERVSGEDYYAYIDRHILKPAGMTRTGHFLNASLPPRTALGYTHDGERSSLNATWRSNTRMLPGRGSAAGGGYSTVGDLKLLLAALRAQKIPGAPGAGVGIAGGAEGLNASVEGALPGGYDLIVMANLDPPAAERISRRVRDWLGQRE